MTSNNYNSILHIKIIFMKAQSNIFYTSISLVMLLLGPLLETKAQATLIDKQVALEHVKFFKTTDDFIKNTVTSDNKVILIKQKIKIEQFDSLSNTLSFLTSKKIIEKENSQISKDEEKYFALQYGDHYFYNLKYSPNIKNVGSWAKIDVLGKYCLILIYPKSELSRSIGNNQYMIMGGGLTGALISESAKWGKNFVNNKQEKIKIIFIDTTKQTMAKKTISKGDLLSKKDLKNLAEKYDINFDADIASVEDIVNFIKLLNSMS